ncbi:acetyl xylan esterase [Opitutaceae bacterium TAV5]|nr:acetyl xylan esterase [Opitutaceae bacterium TAV5]
MIVSPTRALLVLVLALLFPTLSVLAAATTWDFASLQTPPRVHDAPAAYRQALEAANAATAAASESQPATAPLPEGVRAFAFEGLSWKGNPTRVFAFYGAPAGATPAQPVPGIVLVHGAGGTAFAKWVKLWNDRGYAAIAFDHDGGIPVGKYSHWQRNPEYPGPRRVGIGDIGQPPVDQWMYHAVADTILAHSLLASFPEVDAERIGSTGISYGAVILSNVAGIDTRLKFAVPVYGCGYISENEDDGSRFIDSKAPWEKSGNRVTIWRALWDPKNRLPQARVPMLWLNGTNDFAFALSAWQRSYRAAPGTQAICLRVRMTHAHGAPGENPEEIRAFADSIVNGGRPLVRITGQGREGPDAWVTWQSATPLRQARLNFTRTATGRWQDRVWETLPAMIDITASRVSATLPADAAVYFFNLIDDRDLIVSSEHVTMESGNP